MVAVTGGGTGGHIFPIIAVIDVLKERLMGDEIAWIGVKGGREEKAASEIGVRFYGIKAGKLRRYFSLKNFTDLFRIFLGILGSYFVIRRIKPRVLFAKGGFVSVPPVIAAWLNRVPVIIHESDIIPGLATRINSRFADLICVSFQKTAEYFSDKKVFITGNPIRQSIKNASGARGREFLGFGKDMPIVLVIGGSLGAMSINRAVWEMVAEHKLDFYLVHQCGAGNLNRDIAAAGYRQFEFIKDEMGDVMAASDLIVSRAGAGAIYEIAYLKKPMILVPLPKSKSRGEQLFNANYLKEGGASIIIEDERLNGDTLYRQVERLVKNKQLMKEMGENAFGLIYPDGDRIIADKILYYL